MCFADLMGVAQFRLDQPDEALANLKKAIELEPETELYKTELETLEKAIKDGPADPAEADKPL